MINAIMVASGENRAPNPQRVGYDRVTERDLCVLGLDAAEDLPARLRLTSALACLLAWDARAASDAEIARFASRAA